MAVAQTEREQRSETGKRSEKRRRALTIGAVCKILGQEFDDVSISKIRYLEDQKLLAPRRTPGGYRLYSQADVERLRQILRMQRDEFLPLRVIRQELAAGEIGDGRRRRSAEARRAVSIEGPAGELSAEDALERSGAGPELLRELEEYGILQPDRSNGDAAYDETDVEILRAANELAKFGVGGRNLRVFRSSADREATLLEQVLGPALRSRSASRRKEALESLESLAGTCTNLKHLLLVRDLRRLQD